MVRIRRHLGVATVVVLIALTSAPATGSAQTPTPCPHWIYAGEYFDIWNASHTRSFVYMVRGITRVGGLGPYLADYVPDGSPLLDISTRSHQWVMALIQSACFTLPDPMIPGGILVVVAQRWFGISMPVYGGGGGLEDCPQVEIYDPEECEDDDGGWGGGGGDGSDDGDDGGDDGGGDDGGGGGGDGGGGSVEFRCGLVFRDEAGNEWWTCWRAS